MGSVSAAALIITISFFVSFTMLYTTSMDSQNRVHDAVLAGEKLDKGYYDTNVSILAVIRVNAVHLLINITNNGKTTLNPYYLSILINGTPVNIDTISVGGISTSVWAPGETANVVVEFRGMVERVEIVTQYGNNAYFIA